MRRALAYFVAFTGMGSLFMGTLVLAAVVLGFTPPPAASNSPQSSLIVQAP